MYILDTMDWTNPDDPYQSLTVKTYFDQKRSYKR